MVTIRGNHKKIEYALNEVIHECERDMYIVDMPLLVCSNKKDAEIMQSEINSFVSELSRAVLKDE